jgi:hypothetical protein
LNCKPTTHIPLNVLGVVVVLDGDDVDCCVVLVVEDSKIVFFIKASDFNTKNDEMSPDS